MVKWVGKAVTIENLGMQCADAESLCMRRLEKQVRAKLNGEEMFWTAKVLNRKEWQGFELERMAKADSANCKMRKYYNDMKLDAIRTHWGTCRYSPAQGDVAGNRLRKVLDKKNEKESRRRERRRADAAASDAASSNAPVPRGMYSKNELY